MLTIGVDTCTAYLPASLLDDCPVRTLAVCLEVLSDLSLSAVATSRYMSLNLKVLSTNDDRVLYLNKSLYGLKQALRIWYLFLCGVVESLGFVPLETDSCIYSREDITVAVDVDDIQVAAPTKEKCDGVYKELGRYIRVE